MTIIGKIRKYVRTDGLLHIETSAILMAVAHKLAIAVGLCHPAFVSVAITMAVGVAKEVWDRLTGKGTAEWHDVVCDIVGIAIGMAL